MEHDYYSHLSEPNTLAMNENIQTDHDFGYY